MNDIFPQDQGFLYGNGVFTTLKVRESVPLFFERHLERLEKSSQQLGFFYNSLPQNIYISLKQFIKKNKIIKGGVRITITPHGYVIHGRIIDKEIKKIPVITVADTRDAYKTIKMTYRIPHLLAQKKAEEQGAEDALFTQKDFLIESTYANIFSYHAGKIITPPIAGRGLEGITRQVIMEQLPVEEREIFIDTTDPMVLVNSLRMRVVEKIDGREIKQDEQFVEKIRKVVDKAEKEYMELFPS